MFRLCYLAAATALCLSVNAHAMSPPGPLGFHGWVDESVYMLYKTPIPNQWGQYILPSYLSVTGNDLTGELTIHQWDFYDEAKQNKFYSMPPMTLTMTPSGSGFFHNFTNPAPSDPWRIILSQRKVGPPDRNWRIVAFFPEDNFVNQPLITGYPGITLFEFQNSQVSIPEPSSAILTLGLVSFLPLFRRRFGD